VTFLNSCKTTALTSPAILSHDIDYLIGYTIESTFDLDTFAVGIEPCPLLYEIRYGNGTAIVQPHHLFSLSTYEAVPSTYPAFTVVTNSDNSLASSTRIPIIVIVKSKYN
jgi:hypothetical protein